MPLFASLAVGAKVLGGAKKIGSGRKQKKANKQARNVAYANIENQRKTNAETERRAGRDVRQIEGQARAVTGASGFAPGGTNADSVLGTLMSENRKQMDWLKLSNQTQLDSMKADADLGYQAGKAQASATTWGGIGQLGGAASTYDRLFPGSWGNK